MQSMPKNYLGLESLLSDFLKVIILMIKLLLFVSLFVYVFAECGGKNFHFIHESADIGNYCYTFYMS